MCLVLFHRFVKVLGRCKTRLFALVKYVLDYSVIYFSILYIVCDYLLIVVLRRVDLSSSMGDVLQKFLLFLDVYLLVFVFILKNEIYRRKKLKKNCKERLYRICVLFAVPVIVVLLCCIRIFPIVLSEQEVEKKVVSFTQGYTGIEAYLDKEVDERHGENYLYVRLLQDLDYNSVKIDKDDLYILVKQRSFYKFDIGQVCKFGGYLEVPESFDDFDYNLYLKNKRVFFVMENPNFECENVNVEREGSVMKNFLVDIKNKLILIVDKVLNEPQSSLLVGILFGSDRLFSEEFEESVRVAGVSHIVAASGYNITVLVLIVDRMFFFLGKKWRIIISLIIIWMFAMLSGLSASIIRACIMSSISMLAMLFGRGNSVHIAIPLTATIFLIINPLVIFDVGFQLSVSAMLGLVYIQPILIFLKEHLTTKLKFIDEYILPTMSCTIGTLPVSIGVFKVFSIWSIPTNTIILPVIESTMLFGAFALIAMNIFSPFSYFLFSIVNVQLKYFEIVSEFVGGLGFGSIDLSIYNSWLISLCFIVFIIILVINLMPIENERYNYYLRDD